MCNVLNCLIGLEFNREINKHQLHITTWKLDELVDWKMKRSLHMSRNSFPRDSCWPRGAGCDRQGTGMFTEKGLESRFPHRKWWKWLAQDLGTATFYEKTHPGPFSSSKILYPCWKGCSNVKDWGHMVTAFTLLAKKAETRSLFFRSTICSANRRRNIVLSSSSTEQLRI